VRVLFHHVVHEPVMDLRRAGLAQHRIELVGVVQLGAADQEG
jgi:hypothetical protein